MVSQASINAKVSHGLGRAANALGAPCGWYRHGGNNPNVSPVAAAAYRGPVTAAFQAPNTQYTSPSTYAKPLLWGLFDSTDVAPGDYLVDANTGTVFVASTDPVRYPLCVQCNAVLTLTRPTPGAAGASHYEGDTGPDETVLGTAWPASVLNGTKGEKPDIPLPGDTRSAWAAILLPPSFPAQLVTGDIATSNDTSSGNSTGFAGGTPSGNSIGTADGTFAGLAFAGLAKPRRYTLSACELTNLGWRLTGALATL